jgi:predicted DCC family thiol-disulfide oxidoreductase YuxK
MSAVPETTEPWRLFYDGSCNLCHTSMKRLKEWARERNQPLEVHTLQSHYATDKGYGSQMVLEADGKVYKAGDAWLRVMKIAPWYLRWVSAMRHTSVTKWLALTFYNFIANTRHLWFGRRDLGVPCPSGGG